MLEQYFHRRPVLERIERNLLGKHLGAFTEHLHRRGHTANSVQAYVQAAEHFGHWLSRARHTVEDVDAQLVEVFRIRSADRVADVTEGVRYPIAHGTQFTGNLEGAGPGVG
jgi:hypothetical protein